MKKVNLFIATMLLLGAAACTKNGFVPNRGGQLGNVTNSEAADMVSGSLSANSNGVADIATDVSLNAADLANSHVTCGATKSDSVSRQSQAGASNAYSYKSTYNYVVVCNSSSQPDSLFTRSVYSGSFNNVYLSQSNSGSSIFGVSGLLPTATSYVIGGEFKSAGSFASKSDTTNHGSNNIDIAITGLTVTKATRTIASGNANITVAGTVPKKGSFSFTGTLVFNGDHTATLTLNGTVYTINLITGQKTQH
jgi:hypothetical protein